MAQHMIYAFCICRTKPNLQELSPDDSIFSIHYPSLHVVARNVSEDEFGEKKIKENLLDMEWVKTKAFFHERVIEAIMKSTCVIPFKFATMFCTEDNLRLMVEEHTHEFNSILDYLEGKEEWGVKIYCDMEKLKNAAGEDEGILKINREIISSSPGKAFFLEKKKNELIKMAATEKANEYCCEIFQALQALSCESNTNRLFSKEASGRKEEMVLNSAFLVDKEYIPAFTSSVSVLGKKYGSSGFSLDCSGPWPPYNFCSLLKQKVKK